MININLDHFQNGSKFLKKVTIDSKYFNAVEVNVSIFREAVVGAVFDEVVGSLVGAFFCASDESGSLEGEVDDDDVGMKDGREVGLMDGRKEIDGAADGTARFTSHGMSVLSAS